MIADVTPITFGRLLGVEIRKSTDTRSSRVLLGGVLALFVFVLVWKLTHGEIPVSFENYGAAVATIAGFFAPIVGLLAMTSEWTQRTALTTFTLAPRRLPVIAAKLVGAIVVSLATLAVGIAMAYGATALGGAIHGHATYAHALTDIRASVILTVLQVVMASAFGALTAHTASALVITLMAPTIWAQVSPELLGRNAPWFDVFRAYDRLYSTHPFDHLGQTLTAVALWVVLPAAIGIARCVRREVK
ncbi:MAG: hypothetical protein U0Q22_16515 [Acidimicrobiales bacterium]